jgi:hypothetical protein
LIAYLVALHFVLFGLLTFLTIGPSFFSFFPMAIAILLFLFPNAIAYLIGSYLIVNGIGALLSLFLQHKGRFMI